MNKKLRTIQNLKNKLYQIQNNLENLQKEQVSTKSIPNSTMPISFSKNISPKQVNHHKNPFFKSPTYWSGDPILGKENQYQMKSPPKKHNDRNKNKPKYQIPPKIQKIINDLQNDFYQSGPQTTKHQPQIAQQILKEKNKRQQKYFKSNRTPRNYLDSSDRTPRFQKIQKLKTFPIAMTNPILNPDPQKPIGKRIVKKIDKSPQNPYTQNPNSDPWLFTDQKRRRTLLSPSRRICSDKNNSPNMRYVLSSSLQLNQQRRRESRGKKHFRRYFQQNFNCQWA